jgi:putative peptidoglycan lipid II flippase
MSTPPTALRSTLTVSVTRGAAAVLTLIQGVFSAHYFGTSLQKDCFLVAQNLPTMVSSFLIGGVYSTLLVNLAEIGRTEGVRGQRAFAGKILGRLGLALLLPILLVVAVPLRFVRLVAPGFSADKLALTASLLRLTVFVAAGFLFLAAVRCLFETRGQFVVPAFITLANPLASLLILVTLVGSLGIYSLAVGPMVGVSLSLLLLALAIPRHITDPAGFVAAPGDPLEADRRVRRFWIAFLPMSLGANFGLINMAVDNAFASYLPTGSITMLGFAFVIVSNAQLLTTSTFAEVAFSRLTAAAVTGPAELTTLFRSQMRHMLILTAPLSVGAFVMATPIVRLLFQRGAFPPDATGGVAAALRAYAPGIFFLGYLTLFSLLLTSRRRFARLSTTAAAIIVINGGLDFILMRAFGLTGIALGTSLTILVHALLLAVPVRKTLGSFAGVVDRPYLSKVSLSAGAMGVLVALYAAGFERLLDTGRESLRLLEVALGLGIGGSVYVALLLWLDVREAGDLLRRLIAPVKRSFGTPA